MTEGAPAPAPDRSARTESAGTRWPDMACATKCTLTGKQGDDGPQRGRDSEIHERYICVAWLCCSGTGLSSSWFALDHHGTRR